MSQPGGPAAFVVIPEFVSLTDEPGCRRFDIVQMEGAPLHGLFYKVYDSRAAFGAHLRTPRLARFQEGFPALALEERPVRFAGRRHG